jgi:hypothetical protein
MRRPLASRIIILAAVYCAVFCVLAVIQFSNQGSFSLSIGNMTVRGRYLQPADMLDNMQPVTGGVRVFFGGLEFNLVESGLRLTGVDGDVVSAEPDNMIVTENSVQFFLPGGTVIAFDVSDTSRGPELQITAGFAKDITEINIPVVPRRSSLVRDSGQLGIMYNGLRYVFSSLGQELENGYMSLSVENSFMSYRSRGRQRAFDPAEYIIAQEQNYDNILGSWQDSIWNQNGGALQNEDDIIAFLSQSLLRGNFNSAVQSISGNFINSAGQSYRSSAFIGGMTAAYNSFIASEYERIDFVTRLTRERSLGILREKHILDYLFSQSNISFANDIINIVNNAGSEMLKIDYCAGLLEYFYDVGRWLPQSNNNIDHLTEQMLFLISENLIRNNERDLVFASDSEGVNIDYTMRLGKALVYWAEAKQNREWAAIGRSLVLSAVSGGSTGKIHNILNPTGFYPRALWITNDGHWAWTISQSIRASYTDGNLNLAINFPVNMTHHIIIRGVQPFIGIQIHGVAWRTDPQFEIYDSSGWVYHPEEQVLILKLRHRAAVENVRIVYRAPPPPVAVETEEEES